MMIKRFKSFTALVFAFGFLFAVVTTSCGDKKAEESSDEALEEVMDEAPEHPAEEGEHPSEGGEHPSEGGEHPSN